MLGDELHVELVAGGGDTVSARVIDTLDGTVLGTSGWAGADRGVPSIVGVAILVVASLVSPTPVGVEDNGARDVLALVLRRAALEGHSRVILGLVSANLLTRNEGGKDEGEEKGWAEHLEKLNLS